MGRWGTAKGEKGGEEGTGAGWGGCEGEVGSGTSEWEGVSLHKWGPARLQAGMGVLS